MMDSKASNIFPYILRFIFTSIGMLYIFFFTIRGIFIVVLSAYGNNVDNLIQRMDSLARVMDKLVIFHVIIGIYYVIATRYNLKSLQKGKVFFFLQLLSAVAVFIVFYRFNKGVPDHSSAQRIIDAVFAILFGYHVGNGFYNACITLGISVSKRAIKVVKYTAWIVAVISVVQIFIVNIWGKV